MRRRMRSSMRRFYASTHAFIDFWVLKWFGTESTHGQAKLSGLSQYIHMEILWTDSTHGQACVDACVHRCVDFMRRRMRRRRFWLCYFLILSNFSVSRRKSLITYLGVKSYLKVFFIKMFFDWFWSIAMTMKWPADALKAIFNHDLNTNVYIFFHCFLPKSNIICSWNDDFNITKYLQNFYFLWKVEYYRYFKI